MMLFKLDKNGGAIIGSVESTVGTSDTKVEFSLPASNPNKWTAEAPTCIRPSFLSVSTRPIHTRFASKLASARSRSSTASSPSTACLSTSAVLAATNHPLHGRAVPMEFARQELLLMKKHNFNTLRCSYQPNNPELLGPYDDIGLWVMDEAGLEATAFTMLWRVHRIF